MSNLLENILLIVASALITTGIAFLVRAASRGVNLAHRVDDINTRYAKRMDRVDGGIVMLLDCIDVVFDVQLTTLRCYQSKSCNGELQDAVEAIKDIREKKGNYTNASAVSKAAPKETT